MKKKSLNQFALTVICAMVLAACGGSGSSKPTTAASNTTNTTTTTTTTTTTDTAETKKEETTTNTETNTAVNTEDHTKAKTTDVSTGAAFVGAKTVVKRESDFVLPNQAATDVVSDTEGMGVQNPAPQLDTVVVAEAQNTVNGNKVVAYLEDFDISGNTDGYAKLSHIHFGEDDKATATAETDTRSKTDTKTALQGKNEANVAVIETGRLNYTTNYGYKTKADGTLTPNGNVQYSPNAIDKPYADASYKGVISGTADTRIIDNDVSSKGLAKTAAEMYGHFTVEASETEKETMLSSKNGDATINLPLVNNNAGGNLKNVQYGRVTSVLNGITSVDQLRPGLELGDSGIETRIAAYGEFGAAGTEDHYFYRGVNNTTEAELAAVKAKGGILYYDGHAVTYGLNHNYKDFNGGFAAPTAITANTKDGLISGTHVGASINLADMVVSGSLYNKWYNGTKQRVEDVELVNFSGTLSGNGAIKGSATNKTVSDEALKSGDFIASLYGSGANEMGGSVESTTKGENAWGAVFGAIKTNAATSALQNSTNQNSTK